MTAPSPVDCIRICNGIEISAQDDRLYRNLVLPNNLQVCLISDPASDKAAAAMDVNVGHLFDPEEVPGVAHFLEHMLFLGTEKYPDENSYSQYLTAHSGRSNAFTSMTNTNYYFDVGASFLEGALDRFAQFFIHPLFTPSATEREMQAVDSENAKNLQNDRWRFNQLYKHFGREDHPYHKFGTGNLKTLRDDPQAKGIDIRSVLLGFHDKYYSANIMKLVIYGKQPLDELEQLAVEYFSTILNKEVVIPALDHGRHPYEQPQLQKYALINPVKDLKIIEITWPLESMRPHYESRACRYLSHLIGHEGKGSLLSLLKQNGWANELSAGLTKNEREWSMFSVTVEATTHGIEHFQDVVEAVYQYIAMLQSTKVQKWIFDEIQALAGINFRFKNKERPTGYVSSLAGRMQMYPKEHMVSGEHLIRKYNPELITSIVRTLIPSRMRLSLVSKTFENETDEVEKWYQTPYKQQRLPEEWLARWTTPEFDPERVHLPRQNDLISTDFSIVANPKLPEGPVLLELEKGLRLWYQCDEVFQKPKANVYIHLQTPVVLASVEHATLTDLFVACVKDLLTEYVYDAELAGMKYDIANNAEGLTCSFAGYNEKLHHLVEHVVNSMINSMEQSLTQETFDRQHKKLHRRYLNFLREQPYYHAVYNATYCIESTKWHFQDKLQCLPHLTTQHLLAYSKLVFQQVNLEALVHGNMVPDQAKEIIFQVKQMLQCKHACLFPSQSLAVGVRMVEIPKNSECIHQMKEPNPDNPNSAIEVLYQLTPTKSILQHACTELLAHLLREPFFHQLRTIEQLGYLVFSDTYKSHGIWFFQLILQSTKCDPATLDHRIEVFLQTFYDTVLLPMSSEAFDKMKQSLSLKFREKPKTVGEQTLRYWREIRVKRYDFNRLKEMANAVEMLTKEDIKTFFLHNLASTGSGRRKLSLQVFGNNHPLVSNDNDFPLVPSGLEKNTHAAIQVAKDSSSVEKILITDMDQFKRERALFPLQTPSTLPSTIARL